MESEMNKSEIKQRAAAVAGFAWEDRSGEIRAMPLSDQLVRVACTAARGVDGDLTDSERSELMRLAEESKTIESNEVVEVRVSGGIGRVWQSSPGQWRWAHPDGSEGVCPTCETAVSALEELDSAIGEICEQ